MLVLYDTTNYVDHPIGGQLTSVRHFLRYLVESRPDIARDTLLVGVTTDPQLVGVESTVKIGDSSLRFLPVAHAEIDLANVHGSLRMRFAKGLLSYVPKLKLKRDDINFIHTPEAFGPVRLLGKGACVVMSHGSFFNMKNNVRFYKDSCLASLFQRYLVWVVRNADRLLVLDEKTRQEYARLNPEVRVVLNSIIYRAKVDRRINFNAVRLLFVGRLSAVKNIKPIIDAAESLSFVASLEIVGEGEEHSYLESVAGAKTCFLGALSADSVRKKMVESDILVMNSIHEGVPMTILEAMGVGLPIVSTNVGGIGDILRDEVTCLFTDGTSQSIAMSINWLLGHYDQVSSSLYEESNKYLYSNANAEILDCIVSALR